MNRLIALSLAFAAVCGPALAGQPVGLRASPLSRGATITLGDLFDGVSGQAAQVAVARAPAPGEQAVLDAGQVQLAAHAAGLDWDNAIGQRRIIVASGGPAAPMRTAS